jgi:NAD(P) transhydrogenase
VALVEKEAQIGGAGIDSGTVPSKTLRETALALSGWHSGKLFGVDLSLRREATIADFTHHQDNVTAGERRSIQSRLERNGVDSFQGTAHFVNPHTIRISRGDGSEVHLSGEKILVATGSSPWRPPEFPFEDERVHDSDELLLIKALPKRLVVIGAGVIGSEYASNTGELGLAAAGITPGKRGLVPVDANYRSAVPHIYAAGDVVGPPALAATSTEQARIAMCHAFGITLKADLTRACFNYPTLGDLYKYAAYDAILHRASPHRSVIQEQVANR